jgi:hypothetical protein
MAGHSGIRRYAEQAYWDAWDDGLCDRYMLASVAEWKRRNALPERAETPGRIEPEPTLGYRAPFLHPPAITA